MFRKILCPLDFSADSQHALQVAIRLCAATGAELTLVHAWHVPALAYAPELPFPADTVSALVRDEERLLAEAVDEVARTTGRRPDGRFVTGLPWQQVCELLEADRAFDLVVMGSHGRTGFRRILLGSVTEKVVRHAPCSVLAVRGRDGTHGFRHALCPIDFSDEARGAVTLAAGLVDPDGRGLTLLHVLELPALPAGDPGAIALAAGLDRDATRTLAAWAGELRAQVKVPIATRTLVGAPAAQALIALDSEVTYDLVAVGSHGRTGLGRLLLGSVAEQLVRHAPCPVLVARTPR